MADKDLMKRALDIVTRSGDQFNLLDFETRKEISKYKEAMKILTLYQVIESNQEITTSAWRRKMKDWLKSCVDDYEKQGASEVRKEQKICGNCKWCYEGHYEEEGEEPYIKRSCLNKYGMAKGYEVYFDDFCSKWEGKE